MKVTYSDKTLTHKPQKWEIGKYFGKKGTANRIQFNTEDLEPEDFEYIISNGHTLSYQVKGNDAMNRKENFIGTDFIVLDIDSTDLTINEVLEKAAYTPTIIHTTFSNLTEQKQNKHCYHLIYCLNETLYGEENFNYAFSQFSEGIEDLVDPQAKDCHRITFTSNSKLPNYEYRYLGYTHSAPTKGDTHSSETNSLVSCFDITDNSSVKKNHSTSLYYSQYNMNEEDKNLTHQDYTYGLDSTFFYDLNNLSRKEFLYQYSTIYDYITYTPPTVTCETEEGIVYADYRGIDYYELPSLWRVNEDGERKRNKIEIGSRTKQLYVETNLLLLIKPDLTKEHLVYEAVRNVWENYNNTDRQFSNHYILSIIDNIWNNKGSFTSPPIPRNFKILKCPLGMNKPACVGTVRRLLKDESIGNIIDINLSLEDNLKELRKYGVKIKKDRLKRFIRENHLDQYIKTEKQIKEERIAEIIKNNPNASLRTLGDLCKKQNIQVSHETIRTIKARIPSLK